MSKEKYLHIIVYSTSHALKLESLLDTTGIPNKLIPVPRRISSDCGVCIRIPQDLKAAAEQVVQQSGIEIEGILP